VPDYEKLSAYARDQGIADQSPVALARNPRIVEFMLGEVDRATPQLASFEKIKKIALLDRDFEIEHGEITPTLKVKRSFVEEKYKVLIDSLYQE